MEQISLPRNVSCGMRGTAGIFITHDFMRMAGAATVRRSTLSHKMPVPYTSLSKEEEGNGYVEYSDPQNRAAFDRFRELRRIKP